MKSFIAMLVSTLVALGLAEAGLRLVYPDGVSAGQEVNSWKWIEHDPVVAWQNEAGFRHEPMGISINAHNFRGPDVSVDPKPGVTRVICLGDSRTFGIWSDGKRVRADNAYPEYLQSLFSDADQPVEVINAGVIGYSSSHGLRLLVTRALEFQPDVIVASFGFNDSTASWNPALRSIEPASALSRGLLYAFLDFRLFQLAQQAYSRVPGASPEAWSVPWNTPEQYRTHMRRIAEVGEEAGVNVLILNQGIRDLELGAGGSASESRKVELPHILGFENLDDLHERYGIYQAITLEVAREENVALVDGAADFKAYSGEPLFGGHDVVHVNTLGAQRLAQLVYEEILARGWVD